MDSKDTFSRKEEIYFKSISDHSDNEKVGDDIEESHIKGSNKFLEN